MKLGAETQEVDVIEPSITRLDRDAQDERRGRNISCYNHLRAILLEDDRYAQAFGEENAELFLNPDDGRYPYATFMIGLYKSRQLIEPDLDRLYEEISNKESLEELSEYTEMLPEGVKELKHHRFERRAHLSFLNAIGVEKRKIYESMGRHLELHPSQLARPLITQLIRQDDDPGSRILQVNYSLGA